MRTVEIDDDVYNYLQSQAIPFEETPSLTLRRLLRLGVRSPDPSRRAVQVPRQKERKASLAELVAVGLLEEGAELTCCDYTGDPLPDATARVTDGRLGFRGRQYSMSALAQEFLSQNGFSSSAVRGPSHWRTKAGVTIRELWSLHLRGGRTQGTAEASNPSSGEKACAATAEPHSEANMTWVDWIAAALENLRGKSSYYRLYNEILRIRPEPFPASWKAIVRRTIETHSSDSENFHEGNPDLFYSVAGIGKGEWGLRPRRASALGGTS